MFVSGKKILLLLIIFTNLVFLLIFKGRPCQLIVHLDRGFSLLEGGLGPSAKAVWTFSFDKLKGSADDGNRVLFLDFGIEEGDIVSIIYFI